MSYVAILDQVPPGVGASRRVWSPDLFSTADGSYQISNAGSGPVRYPSPFHYYAGSKLAQVEGQIPWAGSGSVVEPDWYSGALAVDPAFTALPDWFSTASKSDPSNWDSLVLTCVQACLVTLTGACSLAATCPSGSWLQAWQRARHQRETLLLKESVAGGSRQGGGAVSLTATLSESFLVAVGDAFDLSAAVEPYGSGSAPTTTISDWHGVFTLNITPLPDGTGILAVTCANQAGHTSGTNPRLITSYDAAAFDAPVTTDEAGQVPLLVDGQPLVLHVSPGAAVAQSLCPVGSYYLQLPATVTGSKTTETVYTSGGQDSATSASGTFTLSPRPVAITVTAGGLAQVALQAGGFTS